MPTMRVTVPAGAWSTDEKIEIADGLASGLAEIAEGASTGDIRTHNTVQIMETATGGHAIGGTVVA